MVVLSVRWVFVCFFIGSVTEIAIVSMVRTRIGFIVVSIFSGGEWIVKNWLILLCLNLLNLLS